jgi:hypothetical protein
MEFAIDPQTSSPIYPSSAISGRAYKCPSCGKPVTVRAKYSSSYTPYFAHKKYVANAECDRYVKSEYDAIVGGRIYEPYIKSLDEYINEIDAYQSNKLIERVSKNLYLTKSEEGWGLSLALSFQKPLYNWGGYICLKLPDREVRLSSSNIEGKHSYPVGLSFNAQLIERKDGVDESIWQTFMSDMPKLSEGFNIFSYPQGTGRLLKSAEALRLGETYTLVSKTKLETVSEFDDLVDFSEVYEELNFYQFSLPKNLSKHLLLTIGKFLDREIYAPRPNIKLIRPLPRKIDIDGTILVSNLAEHLTFQFDCDSSELAYKLVGANDVNDCVMLNSEFIHVDISNAKSFELYWSNTMLIKVEKVYIKRLPIGGVIVTVNDRSADLIDSQSIKDMLKDGVKFSIKSDVFDIKKIRLYKKNQPIKVDTYDEINCESGLIIQAGSFGFFYNQKDLIENPNRAGKVVDINQDLLAWLVSNIDVGDKSVFIDARDPLAFAFPIFSGRTLPSSCRYHLRMLQNILMAKGHI